jgi:glycerol-3-phosphate acyltransferase PlsX
MRIGLDVMGGDHAPQVILQGAIDGLELLSASDRLVLYGDESIIRSGLRAGGLESDARVEVRATGESIGMDEPPVEAVRTKRTSSIVVMSRDASRHAGPGERLDAVISAGNTGACVSAAQMFMRRLPSVHRPGIAVIVPTFHGPIVLIDVGANIEPKPHHLAQYGIMGDVYMRCIIGKENPRVGIMNVGSEEQKGTSGMQQARDFLRRDETVNFIGYVEGREVFDGAADVVITDGVVGNVMIKLAEGLSAGIFKAIAREVMKSDPSLAKRLEPIVKSIYAKHDYHEYGGAPLLGVNGICLICHGSSEARTIRAAIRNALQVAETGVNDAITRRLIAMEAKEGSSAGELSSVGGRTE